MAILVMLLFLLGLGMEVVSSGTYKIEAKHLVYLEPWSIAGFTLGMAKLWPNITIPRQKIVIGLLAVIIICELWQSASEESQMRQPLANACGQAQGYMREISPAFSQYCEK